jgi:serine/threonine protein kinase
VEALDSNNNACIAKLIRCKDSRESEFLEEFKSLKAVDNHVIPLLDTIQSQSGASIIILPVATPLSIWSRWNDPSKHQEKVRNMCRDLVKGVAFIHHHKIAHLDIKLSNLVLMDDRLFLIDFDIAMRCENIEDMVEISCGTPGFAAPEMGLDNDKPSSKVSPIRADIWSCGKVLTVLCEAACINDPSVVEVLKKLLSADPRQRPMLREVAHLLLSGDNKAQETETSLKRRRVPTPEEAFRCKKARQHDSKT